MEFFKKAKKIIAAGVQGKLNGYSAYKTTLKNIEDATLKVAAFDFYRLTVNGKFLGFGPARAAKGFARVDEYSLTGLNSKNGENTIVLELLSYKNHSLSVALQPSFIICEVVKNGKVIAATGENFSACAPETKIENTQRYSYQRHFTECYDYTRGGVFDEKFKRETEEVSADVTFIERVAPYPNYGAVSLSGGIKGGFLKDGVSADPRECCRFKEWGTYDDVCLKPFDYINRAKFDFCDKTLKLPITIEENEAALFDFLKVYAGFIGLKIHAETAATVYVGFSETHVDNDFKYLDDGTLNAMAITVSGGETIDFYSIEPYSLRSLVVLSTEGSVTISGVSVMKFEHYSPDIKRDYKDETLNLIYESAVRSFLHNAVDLFTDCPSRERAGWLCDSYFSAITERFLFNESRVEKAFLQNYLLYKNDGEYEDGVIPMCYPSDAEISGNYIPQWTMWFILEVHDYIFKRDNLSEKAEFCDKVKGLLKYFERYENEDGLLENLPKWNFIEWSDANKWTKDVSYPTNFLYAETLRRAADIVGDKTLKAKAEKIAAAAIKQSFNGEVFFDHAVRENGKLVLQSDCSEICQYYAAFFAGIDVKNDKKYVKLYDLITRVFAADRKSRPEIIKIDMFIGVYMRLLTLLKLGEYDLVLKCVTAYFGEMGKTTRTLWEHSHGRASKNHGFASFAAYALDKAYNALNK